MVFGDLQRSATHRGQQRRVGGLRDYGHAVAQLRARMRAVPDARTQADNCILHFYNWLGDIARQIAAGAAISTDMVKGYAAAFESAAAASSSSSAPRPRLAGSGCSPARCCSTPGLPRVHGLVNGLG